MFLIRFFPAVFVFGLAALGYWLTSGGTHMPRMPDMPQSSGNWFVLEEMDEFGEPLVSEAAPDSALVDLFRFDVRPDDLGSRWRRQSRHQEGSAYHANLETGDLAMELTGSVLYHFHANGRLRRVVLTGTTTDPYACAQFAEDAFGFEIVESQETSAVLRGTGRHQGQLRLIELAGRDEPRRYRVEWSVQR